MLTIDSYETPEDGMVDAAEYRALQYKINVLCEMAEGDMMIHPETVLAMFGREEAMDKLLRKRKESRDWWLGKQKEGMYVD